MLRYSLALLLTGTADGQSDDYLERMKALHAQVVSLEETERRACKARQEEAGAAWKLIEPMASTGRPEGLTALDEFVERYSAPLTVAGARVECTVASLSMARALLGSTNFLAVSSEPSGARVLVDGLQFGVTPFVSNRLPAGRHLLRLELEGHVPMTELVEVKAGEILDLGMLVLQAQALEP